MVTSAVIIVAVAAFVIACSPVLCYDEEKGTYKVGIFS